MKLRDLARGLSARLRHVAVRVPPEAENVEVTGVVADSRLVEPGDLFVAVRGATVDGNAFVARAAALGARAVLTDRPAAADAALPALGVPDARAASAAAAELVYRPQLAGLRVAGITGTNGKTTTAFLLQALLQGSGQRCGMLGTIRYDLGDGKPLAAWMTTPEAAEFWRFLARMRRHGCTHAAVEVSSHALALGRVAGVPFEVGVFTNLTQDHLDFHVTPENYLEAKLHLFRDLAPKSTAVVNADDPAAPRVTAATKARVLHFAIDRPAEFRAVIRSMSTGGTLGRIETPAGELALETPLVGRHNVSNILAAVAAGTALGLSGAAMSRALREFGGVPGRLEAVAAGQPFRVFVDYAHTEDAIRAVLAALHGVGARRILIVVGCGGDRDRTKRPRMGRVASEFADFVVVTSDNPRTEDPRKILEEILPGIPDTVHRYVEVDRAAAIRWAVARAREDQYGPEDVLLIAGKGHEDYQVLGREKVHFDDRKVAREALAAP